MVRPGVAMSGSVLAAAVLSAAVALLAPGRGLARPRQVVVTVVEADSSAEGHSAVIEQVLRDALTRQGYAVVEHPDARVEPRIPNTAADRARRAIQCQADLVVVFNAWYPPHYSEARPVFRITVDVATADGQVRISHRFSVYDHQIEQVVPRVVQRLLLPRGKGLPTPAEPGRGAAVFFGAILAQAGVYLVPYTLLSAGDKIGRRCTSCVGAALSAYYVGSPAISAAVAWAIGDASEITEPNLIATMLGGYFGALGGWATATTVGWGVKDSYFGTFFYLIMPIILPAAGVFVGYKIARRPRHGWPYLGPGRRPRYAWIPPAPTAFATADGRSAPAISLGGLTF